MTFNSTFKKKNDKPMLRTQFGRTRMKKKVCKICKEAFETSQPLAIVCSPTCAIGYANLQREAAQKRFAKLDRAKDKKRKEELKSRSDWLKEVQIEFNKGIRLRDQLAGHWCISCDTTNRNVKMNAGHFLSVGAHPELRFEPLNVHLQCEKCNTHLSGNISAYRPRLIERIGTDKVEWLEGRHEPKKYAIDDLKRMKAEYRAQNKLLEKKLTYGD